MSRIAIPAGIESAPTASQPMLEAVKKQIGVVPNLFRLVANSPAALEGYLGMSGALAKGALPAPTRERIALAVAEINGCNYCLSAHTYMGKNLAKLDDAEITARVKSAIYSEPGLKTLKISVDTVKGVVTLTGSVESQSNFDRVRTLAETVAGVKEVENYLKVKPTR